MKRSERTLCVSLAVFFLLLPTVALSAPHYATAPGMPRIAYSDSGAGGVPVRCRSALGPGQTPADPTVMPPQT